MITPLQLLQLDTTNDWVMVKAVPPSTFEWAAGTLVDIAIPEPTLVPHANFSTILASDQKAGLVEFAIERSDSPTIRHLLTMKQGDVLYLKMTNKSISYPEHGVWIALQEAASVMRGCAIRHQQTAKEIDLVLVQTKKAYFADITRVAGQNPLFKIHVAENHQETLAILRHLSHKPMTVIGNHTQINWFKRLIDDQDLDVSFLTLPS
jgi:hypothetical protein